MDFRFGREETGGEPLFCTYHDVCLSSSPEPFFPMSRDREDQQWEVRSLFLVATTS